MKNYIKLVFAISCLLVSSYCSWSYAAINREVLYNHDLETNHLYLSLPHANGLQFENITPEIAAEIIAATNDNPNSLPVFLELKNQSFSTPEVLKNIITALVRKSIRAVVNFDHCHLDDRKIQTIITALQENKNSGAKISINLGLNDIRLQAIVALAEALKTNKILNAIDLDFNNIGYEGLKALAEGLKQNKTLTMLNLNNCWLVPSIANRRFVRRQLSLPARRQLSLPVSGLM